MGAWGHDSFSNDAAMDWVATLETEGLPAASSAFAAIDMRAGRYLDASDCSCAIAAAEVVAALRGRPAAELPEEVTKWLAANPGDPGDLVPAAQRAVDAVATRSELRDLWEESAKHESWRDAVAELRARLS